MNKLEPISRPDELYFIPFVIKVICLILGIVFLIMFFYKLKKSGKKKILILSAGIVLCLLFLFPVSCLYTVFYTEGYDFGIYEYVVMIL